MATICNNCGVTKPDISTPGTYHRCMRGTFVQPVPVNKPMTIYRPHKCDICGSTAIDHTENQCQMNRAFARTSVSDLVKNSPETKADGHKSAPKPPQGDTIV